MAASFSCDGCGKRLNGGHKKLGFVLRRDYCEACMDAAETFLKERDAIHDAAALVWTQGNADLLAKFREAHPEFRLPDAE